MSTMMKAMMDALAPLARIADAYDANELDDEARKHWGNHLYPMTNTTPPEQIELYTGRGGKRLLTLADCFAARAAIAPATDGEWIKWAGGKQPVADDVKIEWRGRDGDSNIAAAQHLDWRHWRVIDIAPLDLSGGDIVAYRVVQP